MVVKSGKTYDLQLRHGLSIRRMEKAKVRSFEQDGETRWEATGLDYTGIKEGEAPKEATVGFLLENVLDATASS